MRQLLGCALAVMATTACPKGDVVDAAPVPVAITGISPRTLSNETTTPLLVFGRGLLAGHALRLGAPYQLNLELIIDDAGNAHALMPAGLTVAEHAAEVSVPVSLVDARGSVLGAPLAIVLVNDSDFIEVTGLAASRDGRYAFTASQTTDELLALDTITGAVARVTVGDGPWALASAVLDERDVIVIAHRYAAELRIVDVAPGPDGTRPSRTMAGPAQAHALLVHEGIAYVGEHARDQLVAIDLHSGLERWRVDVAPNPRGIALVPPAKNAQGASGALLAVGSLVAGEVTLVALDGRIVHRGVAPRPNVDGKGGVLILGGHTEPYADLVVGGRGVRALVATAGAQPHLLVASSGPNTGPNKEQMEVTTVGGVGVIDARSSSYVRHLAFDFGVPQALALDDARARLYIADVGQGLVHTVDVRALLHKDPKRARAAWLASTPLPLPEGFPLLRTRADFGVEVDAPVREGSTPLSVVVPAARRRAGVEVHTGPSALALVPGGRLLVLERFTGKVTELNVSSDVPVVVRSWALFDALVQRERRLGQVLYFADMGRTGMSCDACHLEGHSEGVFFTKTGMMRLWKSSTVRGVRDTPPYFNPPGHATLEDTASYVGSRNRLQNPPMSEQETAFLTSYLKGITVPPNPFRARDGGLLASLPLEGGRSGSPSKGRLIFQGRCAGCHPAPLFSTDQDESTRRRFMKVGTPMALAIRVDEQDTTFVHRTPPSLVGAWDNWPMLVAGSAGFSVSSEGPFLEATDHSALRAVLERYSPPSHGDAMALSPEQRADLEAYLMSL